MHTRLIWSPELSSKPTVCFLRFRVLLTHFHPDNTPAAALFATNARYKREAYRGSEFAPRILAENGIDVVMKVLKVGPVLLYMGTNMFSE